MRITLIYIANWFGLMIIAILNGALRDRGYGPRMTSLSAHQLSTLIGLALFSVYIWTITGLWPIASGEQAILIGLVWLIMTVTFEFGFGHYVMKHPWSHLLADYNICKGRVWILVLIWTAVAPYLCYRIRL
jgi:hypothetical protein